MITEYLQDHYESDLIEYLKKRFLNKIKISEYDKIDLKAYETEDYALIGIIGLILNNKPRILLGKNNLMMWKFRICVKKFQFLEMI